MLNTRGVSSFKDINTNNTRILVRKTCILLYFIHAPPVFSILDALVDADHELGLALDRALEVEGLAVVLSQLVLAELAAVARDL